MSGSSKQEAPTGEGGHQRRCHDLRNGEEVTQSISADQGGKCLSMSGDNIRTVCRVTPSPCLIVSATGAAVSLSSSKSWNIGIMGIKT